MNKLIILLFSIFIFQNTYSQKKGVYIGLYTLENKLYPITSQKDTIIDGKKTAVRIYLPVRYIITDEGIRYLGYDEWLYESSNEKFWGRLVLAGIITLLFVISFF